MPSAILKPASRHPCRVTSFRPHPVVLQIENRLEIISGRPEEAELESWTRVKSGRNYSSGRAVSMVLLITTRSPDIGTGEDGRAWVRRSFFALRSDGKDDFAELRTGFEVGMGGSRFGERENAVHRGLETPRGHQAHEAVELGLGAHVGAE